MDVVEIIKSNYFRNCTHALDQSKQHRTRYFWRLLKSKLHEIFWIVPIDIDENTDMRIWLGYRDCYSPLSRFKVCTRGRADDKHLGCYNPPPLKESRPEIRSERLLSVEKHVTLSISAIIIIQLQAKMCVSECCFSSGHNMYRLRLI
jgi:hypothetical protein